MISRVRDSPAAQIAWLFTLMLAVPFAIRIADAKHGGEPGPPSYLPALEGPRSRQPFNPDLFLLALLYSLPLWIHSVWKEAVPGSSPFATRWPGLALQGAAWGLAFAAILVLRSRTSLDFIYFRF